MNIGRIEKQIEILATVYPVCMCEKPWNQHGTCGGYIPSRPIEELGTVSFSSPSLYRMFLWKCESFFKRLRTR